MREIKRAWRIGIDARMLGARQTGIGIYIQELLGALLEADPFLTYVAFVKREGVKELQRHKRVLPVVTDIHWYGASEQLELPHIFRRANVDLLHVPHYNVPIFASGPIVTTIHDLTPLRFPGRKAGRSAWRRAAWRFIISRTLKRCSRIIAVSTFTKYDLLKNFSFDPDKLEVIWEGVRHLPRLNDARLGELRRQYRLRRPFIFFSGVWRPHKNVVGLILAYSIARRRLRVTHDLVLAGPQDPLYPEPNQLIHRLGLKEYVRTPGFLDDEHLSFFFHESSAVIVPSYAEGFGLVGLEALSFKKPVAASQSGSLPEILGDAATYFDPYQPDNIAHSIAKILKSRVLVRSLLMKSGRVLRRYSWRDTARKTLDVYQSILHHKF